jgi:hypothetical protein
MAGARLANLPHGGHRRGEIKGPIGPLIAEDVSLQAAAELMGTSVRAIKRARKLLRDGTEDLVALVDADVVSLRVAERPRRLAGPSGAFVLWRGRRRARWAGGTSPGALRNWPPLPRGCRPAGHAPLAP